MTHTQELISNYECHSNRLQSQRERIQATIAELQAVDANLAMQQERIHEEVAWLGLTALDVPLQRGSDGR